MIFHHQEEGKNELEWKSQLLIMIKLNLFHLSSNIGGLVLQAAGQFISLDIHAIVTVVFNFPSS